MDIFILPLLMDNYAYLLVQADRACVIDPADPEPILHFLTEKHLKLSLILSTHHHADHTAGNEMLRQASGCQVVGGGPMVAGVDHVAEDNEVLLWQGQEIRVLATPGHTHDSWCYYLPSQAALFTGDTLFVSGCGRLFEGTAEEMWHSLRKLAALPDATRIYCGHEYALENHVFSLSLQPDAASQERYAEMEERLNHGQFSMPSTLAQEKQFNLFLQAPDPARLADLRQRKNLF
jgi:hydroxyacylglutathione hydrolase